MPRRAPVGEIRHTLDIVEDVEAPWAGTIWSFSSNGSRWVHLDAVITTPLDSSPLYFRTYLQTSKGDVPVTVFLSGISSGCLVGVDDGWFTRRIIQTLFSIPKKLISTYLNYFRPQIFSYDKQQTLFQTSAVGVSQLIHHQFLKVIYPCGGDISLSAAHVSVCFLVFSLSFSFFLFVFFFCSLIFSFCSLDFSSAL